MSGVYDDGRGQQQYADTQGQYEDQQYDQAQNQQFEQQQQYQDPPGQTQHTQQSEQKRHN